LERRVILSYLPRRGHRKDFLRKENITRTDNALDAPIYIMYKIMQKASQTLHLHSENADAWRQPYYDDVEDYYRYTKGYYWKPGAIYIRSKIKKKYRKLYRRN